MHNSDVHYVCPSVSPCFISKATEQISVKFGIGCLYQKLSDKFHLGSYWSNTTNLHEAKMKLYQFSQKMACCIKNWYMI